MSRKKPRRRSPREHLLARTRNIYPHQKARSPAPLDYDLAALRQLGADALTRPCPHCGPPLTPADLSVDHAVPVARGGPHALRNLVVCCAACNGAKGPLTPGGRAGLLTAAGDLAGCGRREYTGEAAGRGRQGTDAGGVRSTSG